MHLSRCSIPEALVRPLGVVEVKVTLQPDGQDRHGGILFQVDILVLDCAPETLHEDIVHHLAATIHANANISLLQAGGEGVGCELRALVGVEDLQFAKCQRLIQSHQTEVNIQRVREPPGDHVAAPSASP